MRMVLVLGRYPRSIEEGTRMLLQRVIFPHRKPTTVDFEREHSLAQAIVDTVRNLCSYSIRAFASWPQVVPSTSRFE